MAPGDVFAGGAIRRTRELLTLDQAVRQVADGGKRVVLIDGEPGVGKSALLDALGPVVAEHRGYLVRVRFAEQDRQVAFGSLFAAFRALVRQLLGESDVRLAHWRGELKAAFGGNVSVLVAAIPELEHIVGKQPAAPQLAGAQLRTTLRLVLDGLIDVLCQPGRPLVLAYDDAHKADADSLKLLAELVADDTRAHLLVVCSYRNVADARLPITSFVANIDTRLAPIRLEIGALDRDELVALCRDTFGADLADAAALADVIARKTGGHPLAIRQLLHVLHDDGVLVRDATQTWRWDLARIEAVALADDVAAMFGEKLAQLPPSSRHTLAIAACIGESFTLEELALLGELSMAALADALEPARRIGVVTGNAPTFRFVHDRVRHAARQLGPSVQEETVHLRLARRLLEESTPEQRQARLFDIVDHLNHGAAAICERTEQHERCRLNVEAGHVAKANGAYAAARHYLATAIACVDTWSIDHALAFALHLDVAEAELLAGDPAAADALLERALANAATDLERVAVYRQQIWQHTARGLGSRAIESGRRALELLGMPLPADDVVDRSRTRLVELEQMLAGCDIESLIDRPEATDARVRAAMEILDALQPSTYNFAQPLYTFVTLELALLSLRHGKSLQSVSGYGALFSAFWALRDGGDVASYRMAHRFGVLAMNLAERYASESHRSRAMIRLGACLVAWVEPVRNTLPILDEGFRLGLASGEVQGAGLNLQFKAINAHFLGTNLDQLDAQLERDQRFARKHGLEIVRAMLEAVRLAVRRLHGRHANGDSSAPFLEAHGKWPAHVACYLIGAAEAEYILGDPGAALGYLESARDRLGDVAGLVLNVTYNVVSSLVLTALHARLSDAERAVADAEIAANQERLARWSEGCPENFAHLHDLVEAERARVRGDRLTAIDAYDRAIEGASRAGFIHHEGIASELAGAFWLQHGNRSIARTYVRRAILAFRRWGATAKVDRITRDHGELVGEDSPQRPAFEANSILRASQTISAEMELEALIGSVFRMVREHTTGERVAVVVKEETGFVVYTNGARVGVALEVADDVPATLLRYVVRTAKSVLIDDAVADPLVSRDPYMQRGMRSSALCVPMLARGTVRGAIYVERSARGAFDREHLHLLEILASQAAISLDNAVLYRSLWASNQQLERALDQVEENARLKKELEIGARIQTSILPVELAVPGLQIAATMLPASEVGGDYYDVQVVPGGAWIGIGDVAGHGLNAGLVMLMVQSAIATLGKQAPNVRPSEILSAVNELVYENVRHRLRRDEHVTLSLLRYEDTGRVVFAGAHEDILVVRRVQPRCEWFATHGAWLGVRADVRSIMRDSELALDAGDLMVVYTDGVIEAMNGTREQFGSDRLAAIAEASHDAPPEVVRDRIVDAVERWSAQRLDDVTVLVARRDLAS